MDLTRAQKKELLDKLQSYYFDANHERLGLIGAENLLTFFMNECAPLVYNQALKDARFVVEQQFSSLDEELGVLEKR
ncbi:MULTISPECIES: DUF2164 domain-containing protein [unclassified Sporolactobacillus]|uniref:DUF2164 domain-containing protein n=1 Tax=unclassified Sporolactobacillus TaxID=2628533 RepID=UPI0023678C41|nr:DUF2164 domain-containing protein [Sporolactobacillus sp. CQH2019]MDD9149527.1 DUF2164 domain-containing protein [Sporolactobacillus sp. CQH2019]